MIFITVLGGNYVDKEKNMQLSISMHMWNFTLEAMLHCKEAAPVRSKRCLFVINQPKCFRSNTGFITHPAQRNDTSLHIHHTPLPHPTSWWTEESHTHKLTYESGNKHNWLCDLLLLYAKSQPDCNSSEEAGILELRRSGAIKKIGGNLWRVTFEGMENNRIHLVAINVMCMPLCEKL